MAPTAAKRVLFLTAGFDPAGLDRVFYCRVKRGGQNPRREAIRHPCHPCPRVLAYSDGHGRSGVKGRTEPHRAGAGLNQGYARDGRGEGGRARGAGSAGSWGEGGGGEGKGVGRSL